MYKFIFKLSVAIIILVIIGFGIIKLSESFLSPSITTSLNQTSVVIEMRALNRLETASYTIEKVIESEIQGNAFQNILYGDKILLIAHANIIAGFDLSKLQNSDVTMEGTTLHIKLPAPEILVSRLDNQQTKVYDRKLGFFTKGDPNLESQARLAAENSIRQAACDEGILTTASDNARKQLETTFTTAGFTNVSIEIPTGVCK